MKYKLTYHKLKCKVQKLKFAIVPSGVFAGKYLNNTNHPCLAFEKGGAGVVCIIHRTHVKVRSNRIKE